MENSMDTYSTVDSEDSGSKTFNVKVTPGITSLNLNNLHSQNMQMIQNTAMDIKHSLDNEHEEVQTVRRIFLALLQIKIPGKQLECRYMLEDIVENHPTHLASVYRDLNITIDADKCKHKYETICKSDSAESLKSKLLCLQEQALAIRIDRTALNEQVLYLQMTDIHQTIMTACKNGDGKRKEQLEQCLNYNKHALLALQKANNFRSIDGHYYRLKSCIDKFNQALKLCPLHNFNPAWRFQYAKALNQYCDTLIKLQDHHFGDKMKELITITMDALCIFEDIADTCLSNDMKRCRAHSLAFIGYLIIERGKLLYKHVSPSNFSNFVTIEQYLCHPLLASKRAFELFQNDVTVLNRFGRAYWLKSFETKDIKIKINHLENALHYLSLSINLDPYGRLAFSTRMCVRRDLACFHLSSRKELLENAKEDGKQCFISMPTRKDVNVLAKICQMLSKYPDCEKYGPKYVKSKTLLYEAFDYIQYGNNLGDPLDRISAYQMGSCLFDLGDYTGSVEWLVRAWLLSSDKSARYFLLLSECSLMLTENESDESNLTNVTGFLSTLIQGKKKYGRKRMGKYYSKLYRKNGQALLNVLKTLISGTNDKVIDNHEKEILSDCLQALKEIASLTHKAVIKTFKNLLDETDPAQETDYELNDVYRFPERSSLPVGLPEAYLKKFKYDYFICYSKYDRTYVNTILIHQLESKASKLDYPLKGCVASRDFRPGISINDNIIKAIKDSYKVVLVLSKAFVSSSWCKKEMDQAITRSVNTKSGSKVIPVLLEECEVPDQLIDLTYLDLTCVREICNSIQRLKNAIIS